MRLKELEQNLSRVKPFARPKMELEQYATDAHIAAHAIYTAMITFGDITGRSVLDLGCGTGILSLACAMLGSQRVLAVDIDPEALEQCRANVAEIKGGEDSDGDDDGDGVVEMLLADVLRLERVLRETFDTVVLNPPFGTKDNAGIDMAFLQQALRFTHGAVYSMHKTATRDYIVRRARESWKVDVQVLSQLKFEIKHQFRFHRKERLYVEVDLIRFSKRTAGRA